jgi:hypothetical protein
MSLTRRSFVKKSAYSAAAVTVLGTGVGLAEGISKQTRKVYQYGIYLIVYPLNPDQTYKTTGNSKVPVRADGTTIGHLEIDVEVATAPDPAKKVTPAEMTSGIPNEKILSSVVLGTKGKITYDGSTLAFLHEDDYSLPSEGWSNTPTVTQTLSFTQKIVEDGGSEPDAPVFVDNPDDDAAKNTAPDSGGIAMVAGWSNYGWSWIGLLENESNVTLNLADVLGWSPDDSEAKTGTITLTWQIGIAKRHKTQVRWGNGQWYDQAIDNISPDVWTPWLP